MFERILADPQPAPQDAEDDSPWLWEPSDDGLDVARRRFFDAENHGDATRERDDYAFQLRRKVMAERVRW